jgi:hypothetical protein
VRGGSLAGNSSALGLHTTSGYLKAAPATKAREMSEPKSQASTTAMSFPLEEQLEQTALVSQQEHARWLGEAQGLKRKAECLRSELEEMDQKLQRVHEHADEARRLHQTLQLDALCLKVRRNDPSTTVLANAKDYPVGYARRLGEALQENTHVSDLDIDLEKLIPSPKDVDPLDISKVSTFVAPLIKYIRHGKAMRSVTLHSSHSQKTTNAALEAGVLAAVFGNRDAIRELTCLKYLTAVGPFRDGMRSTMLKKLDICLGSSFDYSGSERGSIQEAFGSSASLESLGLETEDAVMTETVLSGLTNGLSATWHPYQLKELKLKCHDIDSLDYWTALSAFAHASAHLKHLLLEHVQWSNVDMVAFLPCLAAPGSISKLSLLDCSMDHVAMNLLRQFLRVRKAESEGPPLCELNVTWEDAGDSWSGSTFAYIFCMQNDYATGMYSTIGSDLRRLSVSGLENGGAGFLKTMARNVHRLELQSVQLSGLNADDCRHLATWISKSALLQELELDEVGDARPILASLRINSTLRKVSLPGTKESRLANSYCLRNKHIGEVLESLTLDESDQVETTTSGKYRPKLERGSKSLYPTLLQCANQISANRTSATFSSLLKLCDTVGK